MSKHTAPRNLRIIPGGRTIPPPLATVPRQALGLERWPDVAWYLDSDAIPHAAEDVWEFLRVTHRPTGTRFLLAGAPGHGIAAISPVDTRARRVLEDALPHPVRWATREANNWQVTAKGVMV